jgi:hypothetical protein
MKSITIGGIILIILNVAKAALPNLCFFLPLGGSTIAEMGIVLGLASAIAMVFDMRFEKK